MFWNVWIYWTNEFVHNLWVSVTKTENPTNKNISTHYNIYWTNNATISKIQWRQKKTFLTKIFSSFRSSFHNFRGFLWKILIMHGKSKKFGKKPKQKMLPKRIKIDCFGEWTFQERHLQYEYKKKTSNSSISHSHICPAKICFFSFRFSIYNFFSFFFKYWINNSTYFL